MFKYGKRSLTNIAQCHPDLQRIANELIKRMDVMVICGHRGQRDQDEAYRTGKSKLKWPNSKHNKIPSQAMDVVPYPLDWNDLGRFKEMCGHVEAIAKELGIKIRLGRDFSFHDWPHIELVHAKKLKAAA